MDIQKAAREILARPAGATFNTGIATKAEWLQAAEYALDGDTDDLDHLLTLDALQDPFFDSGCEDFDDWLERNGGLARAAQSYIPALQVAA